MPHRDFIASPLAGGIPPSKPEVWLWGIGGFFAAVAAMLVLEPWKTGIVGSDPRDFLFVAERFAHGIPPHVSAFFPQNALSMMIPGAAIWAAEHVGLDPMTASRLASAPAFAITVGLLAVVALRLSGRRLAALLAIGLMLSFSWQTAQAATGSQPKTFIALFMSATLLAVVRQRYLIAAALAAATVTMYQAAFILPLSLVLVVLLHPRRWRLLAQVTLVGTGVAIAYELYFLLQGALTQQIEQAVRFPAAARVQLWAWPDWGVLARSWRAGAGPINPLPIVLGLTILGLLVDLVRAPGPFLRSLRANPGWAYFLISLPPLLVYTLVDNQGAADMILLMPYASLLTAIAMAWTFERVPGTRVWRMGVVGIVLLAGVSMGALEYRRMRWLEQRYPLSDQVAMSRQVGEWIEQDRTVFVLGSLYLLALNHANNWSPYSISFAVRRDVGYWDYVNGPVDFDVSRGSELPDVIVWARGRPRGWPDWLQERYTDSTPELFERYQTTVWTRRDGTPGTGESAGL